MYKMVTLPKILKFEWDKGNLAKSYAGHGITPREAEEIFVDEELYVLPDIKHSGSEERYIGLGRTQEGRKLFVVFTLRKENIRIISVRRMHKKEVSKYEKVKKGPSV